MPGPMADPMAADPANIQLPATLEQARILGLPPAAFYIPNFISVDEEQAILGKVRSARYSRARPLPSDSS